MRKILLNAIVILGMPQVAITGFYLFARFMLGYSALEARDGYAIATGVVLGMGLILMVVGLYGGFANSPGELGWLAAYERERQEEAARLQAERDKLEAEIGIPRIPTAVKR